MRGVDLYCDDVIRLVKTLNTSSMDLIIADIPYYEIVDESWDKQWETKNDYLQWLRYLFTHFHRVLREDRACYVYSSITHYPDVQMALNDYFSYFGTITWKKQRSRGNGWGFNREEIAVMGKGNPTFKPVETQTLMLPHLRKGKIDYSNGKRTERKRDYKLATSIWDDIAQVCSYRKQIHPTEKPVENARRMIEASSDPGDLVFIPFGGSGSEAEACVRMGRRCVVVEKDPKYIEAIENRLSGLQSVEEEINA